MLELILGTSGTGKSGLLLQRLRQRAEAGQYSLLIVPEQFTSTTESRLYRRLGDSLSGYAQSYSFSSLAEALLRRYGGAAVHTVTDAGRAVLVRRAMEELDEEVALYRRHRRSAAFCQLAAQTVSELKSAGVDPRRLMEIARGAGREQEKLEEIALIYDTYQALLQDTAMDPSDRISLAAERLQPDFLRGKAVFIDEFDTFNASKKKLLAALLACADVTVALCSDGLEDRDAGMGLFSGAKAVAHSLLRMAEAQQTPAKTLLLQKDYRHAEAPGLAALGRLLAGQAVPPQPAPEITLYCANDRQDEAAAVAAAIQKCARQGVPYRKMAVICRTADLYQSAVRYQFGLADIPLFCDEPITPENTAPARAVRAALGLLRSGLTSQNILQLVKSGLLRLSEPQQCALENYAYTWPLRAADWRAPFQNSPEGFGGSCEGENAEQLQLAESARAFLMPLLDGFLQKARGANAAQLSRRLYYLLTGLGGPQQTQQLADQLRAEGCLPQADEVIREWNVMVQLLDQMVQLLGEETLTAAEYDELFALLLRSTDLGHIPQSLDSVIFTTAGRMRLDEVEVCFVMGLAEGEFPQAPGDVGLLTHADRDVMIAQGVELPDCFENRLIREQICFYKALTAAGRRLWLSWPGGDMGLERTSELEAVCRIFAPAPPRLTTAELASTPACALDTLGSLWLADDSRTAALYQALREDEGSAAGLSAVRQMVARQSYTAKDLNALGRLLGPGLRISPSRVERFYSCSFAYFLQYVLHIKPRQKAELSPNQSGSLVHWVLEQALREQGSTFAELPGAQLDALAETLTDRYVQENMPQSGVRFGYLLDRLKTNVKQLLRYLQRDLRQSAFQPTAFEQKIGDGPDEIPPVRLQTPEGQTVQVVGTIDRVDSLWRDGHTYLRVVDYKTGEKHFRLDEVYCGLDCQMLLYLFTLSRNGGQRYPDPAAAGVLYLMADPAPENQSRQQANAAPEEGKVYRLDGLILDDPAVIHAMDREASGLFVPFGFGKNGAPTKAGEKLASLQKLGRIQKHIDHLVIQMARQLYAGRIDNGPLRSRNDPCAYCDYRIACHHLDGVNERELKAPEHVFESDIDYQEETL